MSILQKSKKLALDILFPISCLSCGNEDVWICEKCLQKMQLFLFQICPRCERFIIESGKLCQPCKRKSLQYRDFFLDCLIVSAKYKENNLSKIIHAYKYNLVQDLHIPLGKIMVKALLDNNLPLPDIIIPVPLHRHRLRSRGFNQSDLLANYVSQNLTPAMEIPIINNILIRKKYSMPQMKIKKYTERMDNMKNIFALKNLSGIEKKDILLVDDVATTGATLNECAKVLKSAGAKKVFGIVLARQEWNKKLRN